MYLHLGQDTVIRTEDIVAILDMETTSIAKSTRFYLSQAQKKGNVINVSYEIPKTFVVCKRGEEVRVYITHISSGTLKKRTGFMDLISNIPV